MDEGTEYAIHESGAQRAFALVLLGLDAAGEATDPEPVEIGGQRLIRFQSRDKISGPNTVYRFKAGPTDGYGSFFDIVRLPYPKPELFESLLSSFRVAVNHQAEARAPTER